MPAHRFVFPKVTEIRVTRGQTEAGQPLGSVGQRDLVAASLLLRPDARDGS
ncbi:MAG: hypothetical protein QOI64_2345, partial [Solirubrobacteraceae bacterium]|nr:hypothetical protein [Solirubrobacteraceae bacterium]